jgi:hypothetical protein
VTDRLAWGLLAIRVDAGVADPATLAAELAQVGERLARCASGVAAVAAAP